METANLNRNLGPKIWYDANCHCRKVQLRLKSHPFYFTDSSSEEEEREEFHGFDVLS